MLDVMLQSRIEGLREKANIKETYNGNFISLLARIKKAQSKMGLDYDDLVDNPVKKPALSDKIATLGIPQEPRRSVQLLDEADREYEAVLARSEELSKGLSWSPKKNLSFRTSGRT